jgi:hypothetical protein
MFIFLYSQSVVKISISGDLGELGERV